jgi:hypothetical protein
MSQVLIDGVENMLEVFLAGLRGKAVGKSAKTTVEPAGTCPHEGILTGKLGEHVLLEKGLNARLQLKRVPNLITQVAHRVKNGLFYTEVL